MWASLAFRFACGMPHAVENPAWCAPSNVDPPARAYDYDQEESPC